MPRKSSSTVTPATPRKTRTRKTTTSRRKSASKINTSTAFPQLKVADVKEAPISEVKKVDTPVKVRPSQPNLKVEDYLSDFKVRWQIHQFETQELWADLVKGYNFTAGYVKDSYNKAFN